MDIVKKEKILCVSCMEEHEVPMVKVRETNVFKDMEVEYEATYFYCENSDEYYADEEMISSNDIAMKNAYRAKVGLLTSHEIVDIRKKYGISQSDLATLLGWGAKTITRYESHQVQDVAHDTVLRKINEDPEWYLELLKRNKDDFSERSYQKYYESAKEKYADTKDEYLRKSINSQYVKYKNLHDCNGNRELNLEKVVDAINYFANSPKVTFLYAVKLMKLLWYSDALSYKRNGHSITGLVYKALPMGAVPLCYDLIIDLKGIKYELVDFGDNFGYHFIPSTDKSFPNLTEEEKGILDEIIIKFGNKTKNDMVRLMHKEVAYIETAPNDVIQFKYTIDLSLD